MGQKIHPTGFRIGVNKTHNSTWFADYSVYSKVLQEDFKIRNFFEKEWGAQHVEFMNKIIEFINDNVFDLDKILSLIEKTDVNDKGEVTKECQKSMKDALTKWYEPTFNFTKILVNFVRQVHIC